MLLFRAVITVLAGKWDSSLRTRFLNNVFFALVAFQKRFKVSKTEFRRDHSAGYPG